MSILVLATVFLRGAGAAETFAGHSFYFGDPHVHTGVSLDGGAYDLGTCTDPTRCASLADAFAVAQANGMDFVAYTDHSNADPSTFDAFLAETIAATTDTFVTIPAVELALRYTTSRFGHKNAYVFQDDDALLTGLSLAALAAMPPIATCPDMWTNAATLSTDYGPTLMFAHHPAAGNVMATDWSCHDQTYEPVVEVYSGHGNSLDYDTDYDELIAPVEASTVHEALETFGLKVGFVGGTDGHDTRAGEVCETDSQIPVSHIYGGGLTMVVLDEGAPFVRSAIYDEMVARRTLATSGPEMPVLVSWITSDGNEHAIGEELVVRGGDATDLEVAVPAGWEAYVTGVTAVGYSTRIPLAEGAAGTWSVSIDNDTLPDWLYAEVAIDGAALYGAGVCDDGGADDREFVWSSPAWFATTDDLDGDGYDYDVDCNDDVASIHPGALERPPKNGIDEDCDGIDKGKRRPH